MATKDKHIQRLLDHQELSPDAVELGIRLSVFCFELGTDDTCTISIDELSDHHDCSRAETAAAIGELLDRGLFTATGSTYTPTTAPSRGLNP